MDPREQLWNNKFPKKPVIYNAQYGRPRDPRTFLFDKSYILEQIVKNYGLKQGSDDDTMLACLVFVQSFITYKGDMITKGQKEFWQNPEDTTTLQKGDCIAEYETIHTKEGVKKASEVKLGDLVLSYDFNENKYVYKPIINLWDKGIKPIKRVHFRNGQYIDVTDEHHMLMRTNQIGNSKYEKTDLKDVDLSRWWKRRVPLSIKIPYYEKDIEWLTEDLCFVIGYFLAGGWVEKSYVVASGYDIIEHIIPKLEKHEIPFSEYINKSGIPCLRLLNSDFNELLKKQKTNSFDIHLEERFFHLPANKLEAILNGFCVGDQYNGNYEDKKGYNFYSTLSEKWATDIQRIGLQIGKPFHIWKQGFHGGLGDMSIWRITYNTNSDFLENHGHNKLGEVSISYIEDMGECQTYDWEVEDTHNFFFKNGICTSQCEDGAILIKSLSLVAGIPDWKVKVNAGHVKGGGHAYCTYIRDNDTQCIMDWCYWPNRKQVNDRPKLEDEKNYYEIWFSFNREYTFAPKHTTYSKGLISLTKMN